MKNVSIVNKQTNLGRLANNSISESFHTSAREGLKTFGMIQFAYIGAMGQSRVNSMTLVEDMILMHHKD